MVWGRKDDGQARILAIDISRIGFEWALENSCLSHRPEGLSQSDWTNLKEASSVRIQWDPERDVELNKLEYRSIQIGLSGVSVEQYIHDWIVNITDITETVHSLYDLVLAEKLEAAKALLPTEKPYPLSNSLERKLGIID